MVKGSPPVIVVLLGAGASADAGLPTAKDMLQITWDLLGKQRIPGVLEDLRLSMRKLRGRWTGGFEGLMDHLRYGSGLPGDPEDRMRLYRAVLRAIGERLLPKDRVASSYFRGLYRLCKVRGTPLYVLTLNYDLLVEWNAWLGTWLETDFPGYGPSNTWRGKKFLSELGAVLHLCKLHGSANWHKNDAGELFSVDPLGPIDFANAELVLGLIQKEREEFPYPFEHYKAQFKGLPRGLLVALGYSFVDGHINLLVGDAVQSGWRLLVVTRGGGAAVRKRKVEEVRRVLRRDAALDDASAADRIVCADGPAGRFLAGLPDTLEPFCG